MICHRHKVIFVHTRKAAGSSVISLFPGAERPPLINGTFDPAWGDPAHDGYFSFAVVRNPWDRFVSGWKYLPSTRHRSIEDVLRHLPQPRPGGYVFAPGASAAARWYDGLEFLGWQINRVKMRARRLVSGPDKRKATGRHDYLHLTLQQWQTCLDAEGRLALDRVVFYERLAEGLTQVFAEIGLPPPELPHLRKTADRDDYRRHFTPGARALFDRIYARDIATWGYDFDTGQPGTAAASIRDLAEIAPAPVANAQHFQQSR